MKALDHWQRIALFAVSFVLYAFLFSGVAVFAGRPPTVATVAENPGTVWPGGGVNPRPGPYLWELKR